MTLEALNANMKPYDYRLHEARGFMGAVRTAKALMKCIEGSEVLEVMDDLRRAEVDFLTVGQYLRPTRKNIPVARYLPPAEFEELACIARAKGFLMVSCSPLTRSSYHADRDFRQMRERRAAPARPR